MAQRGVSLNPGYIPGSHWADCDRCDSQFRAEDLKQEWNGLWVCTSCFETRHPQDFLRAKEEKIAADEPLNPSDTSNYTSIVPNLSAYTAKQSLDTTGYLNSPRAGYFKPDGTKLIVQSQGDSSIEAWDLSTPWDLSTAVHSGETFSTASEGTSSVGMTMSPDGTKMFVCFFSVNDMVSYDLGTAWDVTTAVYNSDTVDTLTTPGGHNGISMNSTGTKMYLVNGTGSKVYQWTLNTAWTLAGATYDSVEQSLTLKSTVLGEDNILWHTLDAAGTLVRYTLSTASDITSISLKDTIATGIGSAGSAVFMTDKANIFVIDRVTRNITRLYIPGITIPPTTH